MIHIQDAKCDPKNKTVKIRPCDYAYSRGKKEGKMFVEENLIFLVSSAELLQEKVGELNELLHFLVTLSTERSRGT